MSGSCSAFLRNAIKASLIVRNGTNNFQGCEFTNWQHLRNKASVSSEKLRVSTKCQNVKSLPQSWQQLRFRNRTHILHRYLDGPLLIPCPPVTTVTPTGHIQEPQGDGSRRNPPGTRLAHPSDFLSLSSLCLDPPLLLILSLWHDFLFHSPFHSLFPLFDPTVFHNHHQIQILDQFYTGRGSLENKENTDESHEVTHTGEGHQGDKRWRHEVGIWTWTSSTREVVTRKLS